MEIPRSLLDSLTKEVNALSNAAQAQARTALSRVFGEWDGSDIAALRVACIEVLDAVCGSYADLSAARGAAFYDAAREAQGVRGSYRAAVDSHRDPAKTESSVRSLIESVKRHGDTDAFGRSLLSRVDLEVRRSANECVAYNARKDPKKPRYARVPSGGETCGFCLMLASFGFNWRSPEQASHCHKHCDCRVVPSFGEGSIPGYDPDGMYDRFNECLDTIGGRDGLRKEWLAIPEDDRGDFQKYVNKRVSEEIEFRDPEWFAHGKVPNVEFASEQVMRRATDAEKRTASRLAGHGVKPVFIQDYMMVAGDGKRKHKIGLPDLENGIEIKTLGSSGNAWGAVDNYLESSSGKKGLKCVVIDNRESQRITDDELMKAATKVLLDYPDIPGLRLLLKDGSFVRVK